jgi:hypothetical protein
MSILYHFAKYAIIPCRDMTVTGIAACMGGDSGETPVLYIYYKVEITLKES